MKVFELNPHINPDIWAGFMERLRKDGVLRFETLHRRKNGEIMDVEIVANYVTREGTEYSIAFVRDITDRKRVERDLLHKNEELKAAYEHWPLSSRNSGDNLTNWPAARNCWRKVRPGSTASSTTQMTGSLCTMQDGAPGRFIEVNDFLCSALGYTREELLAMGVKDILSEAH